MASSVARMPPDGWRDHGRLSAGVFAAHPHLKKVLLREGSNIDVVGSSSALSPPSSSSCSSTSTCSSATGSRPKDGNDSRKLAAGGEAAFPSSDEARTPLAGDEWKQRRSQILDRWAARQARGMVTTIEQQAHHHHGESELSAPSTTGADASVAVQPVAAMVAHDLPESSLMPSDSSDSGNVSAPCPVAAGGGHARGISIDVTRNVRASSLIQMWRELEAEAGLTPAHRTTSGCSNSGASVAASFTSDEPSGNCDGSDELEAFGDWEPDMTAATTTAALPSSSAAEPAHSSSNESETGRVGSIVRMLSGGRKAIRSSITFAVNESPVPQLQPPPADEGERLWGLGPSCLTPRRMRCRRELEDFAARVEQERRKELDALSGSRQVSGFAYRGRLQSMLRVRSMRQQLGVQDQVRRFPSAVPELRRVQSGSAFSFLRQRFNHEGHPYGNEKPDTEGLSKIVQSHILADSENSGCSHPGDEANDVNNQYHEVACASERDAGNPTQESNSPESGSSNNPYLEVASAGDSESPPPEANSPQFRAEVLQEASNSANGSWDERNLWMNNLAWQTAVDSSPSNDWNVELVGDELESYTQQDVVPSSNTWICESPDSWRGWGVNRQATSNYHDMLANFSDNVEIRELLERRRVSTSLASDFCDKMNQLISSFLHRRSQQSYDDDDDDYDEQPFWRQSYQIQNSEQLASASSSLVPLPYHTMHHSESWQHNSLVHDSSSNPQDMEAMGDLRSDMTQIHHELSELRKLVESCMEWQINFQHSVKQEISEGIRQSGCFVTPAGAYMASHGSNQMPGRKGSCCICYEMPVDSLLYKCGHMCTCFKCAYELQWSSGKCPICRSQIMDVVRAYPYS